MQAEPKLTYGKEALIALGANLPAGHLTPAQAILQAIEFLSEKTSQKVVSSRLYRTPAYPVGAGPDFVNAAARICWSGTAQTLLDLLHEVETALGRTRKTRWEARIMDLDLIALGQTILPDADKQTLWADLPPERAATETPEDLILPHPRLAERSFVLVPLAEIAPDWRHPLTDVTVSQMLAARPIAERREIWPLLPENTGASAASPLSIPTPGGT